MPLRTILIIAALGAPFSACRPRAEVSEDLATRPAAPRERAPTDREVKTAFNKVMMKKLHGRKPSPAEREELASILASYKQAMVAAPPETLACFEEELVDPEFGVIKLSNFLKSLEAWVSEGVPATKDDLGLNFVATRNNSIQTLSDKEQFWPALMQDLSSAKDSINIVIFGLMGDEWGKEVFELLSTKVREGVRVRILADALGARDHWYFKYANKDFLDEMRSHGLEIITTSSPEDEKGLHFDHRKFYIIDGKVAHNTGYTIEEHMRHVHFDMGFRIEGDMVRQMQAHFFASYFFFGGKLATAERSFTPFMKRYFPQPSSVGDEVAAHLLVNIPWVQHRATEGYYARIAAAKKKVTVINEFMSESTFLRTLKDKIDEGIAVEIIYPRLSEWSVHRYDAFNFFESIKQRPNVKIHLYDGPKDTGWLHTKGIVIDDEYISFGSTNFDQLSLYHNYETNIETHDPRVVAAIQEKVIDYAIKYSKPYAMPNSLREKIRTWTAPAVSIPLKYFFKAM